MSLYLGTAERMVHSFGAANVPTDTAGIHSPSAAATAKLQPTNEGFYSAQPPRRYAIAALAQGYFLSAGWGKKKKFSKTILPIIELGHMPVHEGNGWFPAPLMDYLLLDWQPFWIKQATRCPASYEDTTSASSRAVVRESCFSCRYCPGQKLRFSDIGLVFHPGWHGFQVTNLYIWPQLTFSTIHIEFQMLMGEKISTQRTTIKATSTERFHNGTMFIGKVLDRGSPPLTFSDSL